MRPERSASTSKRTSSPAASGCDSTVRPRRLRMRLEPEERGATDALDLDVVDHLDRVAEAVTALRLHLDEREHAAAAGDDVELGAAEPAVVVEDSVAAPPQPARRPNLRAVPRRRRARRGRRALLR